jgi:hypothetical protein
MRGVRAGARSIAAGRYTVRAEDEAADDLPPPVEPDRIDETDPQPMPGVSDSEGAGAVAMENG